MSKLSSGTSSSVDSSFDSAVDVAVDGAIDVVIARLSQTYNAWGRATPLSQMRSDWDALMGREMPGSLIEQATVPGVTAQWLSAPGARADKVLLYFHGGGFQLGSLVSHRELMVNLSAASGCRVLGVAYRLAPEQRFPAPLQDALAAYKWLLTQGFVGADIALAGDSAGGGLALSLLISLRDAILPMPATAALMSPWTDMSACGESFETRAQSDPLHQRPMMLAMARNYLGEEAQGQSSPVLQARRTKNPRDPLASPLFADLHGLPPLLIQVGDREVILSDSTAFATKARAAGVQVKLQVWNGMIHVFQQFPSELVQARLALAQMGDFLKIQLQIA